MSTPMSDDYKLAARMALDVQDACNLTGVAYSFKNAIDAVCARANQLGESTNWKNTHPIVTLFLLKMAELNHCGSTLDSSYGDAEAICSSIASGTGDYTKSGKW